MVFSQEYGFQSTLPTRGETGRSSIRDRGLAISIHSSHTGRDDFAGCVYGNTVGFQSTLPIREETLPDVPGEKPLRKISIHSSHTGRDTTPLPRQKSRRISIHSSHTGRDLFTPQQGDRETYFNPLFPYGKRHAAMFFPPFRGQFQSTLPIREETLRKRQAAGRGADFNPLFPYGKRQ